MFLFKSTESNEMIHSQFSNLKANYRRRYETFANIFASRAVLSRFSGRKNASESAKVINDKTLWLSKNWVYSEKFYLRIFLSDNRWE